MSSNQQALILGGAGATTPRVEPVYISRGTFVSSTAAPVVPPPSAYQNNDLLVLLVHTANQAITTPGGWTQFTNSPQFTGTANAAGGVRLGAFYKLASGTEANVTITDSGGVTSGSIAAIRRVQPAPDGPADVTAGSVKSAAAGTTFTLPSVTTTFPNDLILLMVGQDRDANSTTNLSGWTNANLTSITQALDQTSTDGPGGGLGLAYGIDPSAGSLGTTTVTSAVATTAAFLTVALESSNVWFNSTKTDLRVATINQQNYNSQTANASMTFGTDGIFTYVANNNPAPVFDSWTNSLSTGIGSSYWIRYSVTSVTGTGTWGGDSANTWLSLSTARTWWAEITSSGSIVTQSVSGTIELSTDSGGATIVARAPTNLVAISNPGAPP